MAKLYTGRVVAAGIDRVTIRFSPGRELELRCSAQVAVQAAAALGRRVRFTAALSEHTQDLLSPVLVIGSQQGLLAVDDALPVADAAQ